MLYSKNSKGQVISTDFILAIIILLFILHLTFSLWNSGIENFRLKEKRIDMEERTINIIDILVKSPGKPSDWENGNPAGITLGLAEEHHIIATEKLSSLFNLSKEETKDLLGVEDYNFFFIVKSLEGQTLDEYGDLPTDAKEVVVARRLVMYNNNETYLNFGLWI